jgi:hypothetical protein
MRREIEIGGVYRVYCDPTTGEPLPVTERSIVRVEGREEGNTNFPYSCTLLFGEKTLAMALNFSAKELEPLDEQENE